MSKFNETMKSAKLWLTISIVLLIVLGAAFAWVYLGYRSAQKQISYLSTPEAQKQLAEQEISDIVNKVKRHMQLSESDTPSVATIADVEKLSKQQPFFQNAANGDKLLVYKDKAIIYSVDKDLIINVGPVTIDDSQKPASVEEPKQEEKIDVISIEIRNGSGVAGQASTYAETLKGNSKYNIIKTADAAKTDYAESVIVNLGNKDISGLLEGDKFKESQVLPEGEKPSLADVLIILGNK